MPPQITCVSALPGKTGKHGNHIFHSVGLCYTHNATMHMSAVFLKKKQELSSSWDGRPWPQ